jgi:hypothetical protein
MNFGARAAFNRPKCSGDASYLHTAFPAELGNNPTLGNLDGIGLFLELDNFWQTQHLPYRVDNCYFLAYNRNRNYNF